MIAWLQVILNERILAPETKAVMSERRNWKVLGELRADYNDNFSS